MAVTVTDNRTTRNEADANTGWTGTTTLLTADPDPVEATGCLGATVGAAVFDSYHTAAAANLSNKIVYCWAYPRGVIGLRADANGGLMVTLGDGTNRAAFKVAGADVAGFRHDIGPTPWQCIALDTSNLPASPLSRQGVAADLSLAAVTQVGTTVNSLVAAPGMASTYIVDLIRIFDPTLNDGCALTITGGTSGTPGKFSEIATEDASTANLKAHGVVRQLGEGAFGVQAPLRFGNPTGTASSWFEDKNVAVIFESRGFTTARYKIVIVDNGVGTTTFRLGTKTGTGIDAVGSDGCTITTPTGVGAEFDANTDADVTDVGIYGSTFTGFTNGVKLRQGHEFISGSIVLSGQVIADGATMVRSKVLQSTVAADASALRWNSTLDPDTHLDRTEFSKGTAAHHAIEFGTTSPTTFTLRRIAFSGFNASNAANDSALYIKRTTGTVTISLVGCSGNISYKTDGATVVLVQDPVTVSLNAVTALGVPVQDARVLLVATTGGPFFHDATVTISNSGTTATVTHTAHGIASGDKVQIKAASLWENNGVFEVTVTGVGTYTYTMPADPGSSPTGTIKAAFVVLSGLTDVNGALSTTRVYPSSQPFSGRARKSTSAPFYRTAPVVGTVSNTAGATLTALMIEDQ